MTTYTATLVEEFRATVVQKTTYRVSELDYEELVACSPSEREQWIYDNSLELPEISDVTEIDQINDTISVEVVLG